uniref:ATP-dependent Clp protease proteolytic subunit n=1 Tax=Matthiola alyssifolia TaxID=691208 RepID=A0A6M8Z1U2_9BRAS|nr:ATP-dependent protease subunit [Matthiola alyssifolia]QKK45149.1 ATP-dependent protease subunit [Matthiola alyssifolia]
MPIGVPKVAFLVPGEDESSWVDVYNRLYRERLLFLGEDVSAEASNQLCGLMIFLGIEDSNKDTFLFINSPGGGVLSGIAIYDTMHFVDNDVDTICMGLAASTASLILVGGTITKRFAFPHARIMLHQPASAFYQAQTGEFIMESKELLKLRANITDAYLKRTGKPMEVLSKVMERDYYMSPTEAQAHGVIDFVGVEIK